MKNVIAWSIVGDALGAGYEGRPAFTGKVGMIGGGFGNFAPYEWTDDTIMMIPLLKHGMKLDEVVRDWTEWHQSGPADIGTRTAAVLAEIGRGEDWTAAQALAASRRVRTFGSGNAPVMRVAPVAFMGDDLYDVFRNAVSTAKLTHNNPIAAEAAGIWAVLIRNAYETRKLDLSAALQFVGKPTQWRNLITGNHGGDNGLSTVAISQAYSAVARYGARQPLKVLEYIIRQGGDTDTVSCIAGGLIGALTNQPPPAEWVARIHGYPGMTMTEALELTSSWV